MERNLVDHCQHVRAEGVESDTEEPQIYRVTGKTDEDVRSDDGHQEPASVRINHPLG